MRKILDAAADATALDLQVDNEFGTGSRDESTKPYLGDVLLRALAAIWSGHPDYAEAVRA